MKTITVVAAVKEHNNKILCMQRGNNQFGYISFKYEFPGGKIEPGESDKQALKREIKEELDYDIDVRDHIMTINYQYPDFKLIMDAYYCHASTDKFTLKEHIDFRWLPKNKLKELEWVPADNEIVEKVMKSDE